MKRYFFDVASRSQVQYDFQGPRAGAAGSGVCELAELIALDIECIDGDGSFGMEVHVRNIGGQMLFTVPIRDPEMIAA